MTLEEREPDDILLSYQHFPTATDGRMGANWLPNEP